MGRNICSVAVVGGRVAGMVMSPLGLGVSIKCYGRGKHKGLDTPGRGNRIGKRQKHACHVWEKWLTLGVCTGQWHARMAGWREAIQLLRLYML
jgi:hypothetical protein